MLAAKREMTSWRFISLEPTAMRRSNSYHDTNTISSNGNHLASTLHKLSLKNKSVCGIIARKLNDITRVENVRVDIDKARELLTLEVKERSGAYIPARGLSDGTLRFLALCIMSEDPDFNGLLCFEEPENGIHPAKMNAMFELLHELAIDVHDSVSDDNPMRQMIIATHSPVMVQLQYKDDLLYADVVKVKGPFGKPVSTIRCRPLQGTWRDSADINSVDAVSKSSIIAYLTAPVNAQLSLDSYLEFYEN
ncbi:TPA: AAA family ATPase [Aeromonas hydrophila]